MAPPQKRPAAESAALAREKTRIKKEVWPVDGKEGYGRMGRVGGCGCWMSMVSRVEETGCPELEAGGCRAEKVYKTS